MKPEPGVHQLTRGEREAETEAGRLIELIEDALALVAVRARSDVDALEGIADRIERAARDLSVALRELAREGRANDNEVA